MNLFANVCFSNGDLVLCFFFVFASDVMFMFLSPNIPVFSFYIFCEV